MKYNRTQLNPHACRTYLLTTDNSSKVALVDPVLDHVNDYVDLLQKEGYSLSFVVDTHTHADHISGGASLKDMTECEYVMHKYSSVRCAGFRVDDGFTWEVLKGVTMKALHTPGHTKDSMCLLVEDDLYSGDTIFLDDGGAGRDDLPGGDPEAHWESLQKLSTLPDYLTVYPAHDYRNRTPSSLKRQKMTNPHLQKTTKDEYVRYLEDLRLGPADWMKDVLKANYTCARDPQAAWIPVDSAACEVMGTMDKSANEIEVPSISTSTLRQMLTHETPPILLDVRERSELDDELGHIDGILHIPIASLAGRIGELSSHKDSELVTVCRFGPRARTAAQILTLAGFTRCMMLKGGMFGWRKTEPSG